jgi:tRNA-Thr(GGU) m(6)t(6)A37 methyltransferase TsaA
MNIEPIGIIRSCFKQKFGIPRQPGLVPEAKATLELLGEYNQPHMVRGLESFSHIWLLFHFHATADKGWQPMVRPPRLGGNERMGVLASRSMFRPNGMGLSVCKLDFVKVNSEFVTLGLSGIDVLDETPVFDVKPYLPYVDAIEDAQGAYASEKPFAQHEVGFSELALSQCLTAQQHIKENLVELISQILAQDPRPAFHQGKYSDREYTMQLYNLDITWCYKNKKVEVVKVLSLC